jgi:hypothetical protein
MVTSPSNNMTARSKDRSGSTTGRWSNVPNGRSATIEPCTLPFARSSWVRRSSDRSTGAAVDFDPTSDDARTDGLRSPHPRNSRISKACPSPDPSWGNETAREGTGDSPKRESPLVVVTSWVRFPPSAPRKSSSECRPRGAPSAGGTGPTMRCPALDGAVVCEIPAHA